MIISRVFAEKMEQCFMKTHHSVMQKRLELGLTAQSLPIGTGAAFELGSDSFLSQVIGWGFNLAEHDIAQQCQAIEDFYRHTQMTSIAIELSPLVGQPVIHELSQRGYHLSELTNISWLDLDDYIPTAVPGQHEIVAVDPSHMQRFANALAIGFDCPNHLGDFSQYIQSDAVQAYQVNVNGAVAAGGTIALHGKLCDLGVTTTLPGFRGHGLHKALLNHRLALAQQQGAKFALVATEPGSISDTNIQKVGFHCGYTRLKFCKALPSMINH